MHKDDEIDRVTHYKRTPADQFAASLSQDSWAIDCIGMEEDGQRVLGLQQDGRTIIIPTPAIMRDLGKMLIKTADQWEAGGL